MKAVLCPVCNGVGHLIQPPNPDSSSATGIPNTCHGCGGLGWVSVPEDKYIDLEEALTGKKTEW